MACLRRAGLASVRQAFSTIQLRPQQLSPASPEWHQNLDSTHLKIFQNGKSFPRSQELILSHKFYSKDASAAVQNPEENQAVSAEDENPESQALNSEEEEDTLPQLNKIHQTPEKKKWKLVDALREIWQALEKGDADMEETLTQLRVQVTPRLVKKVLDTPSSPRLAMRFFQWAKAQPGFRHSTSTYDMLVDVLGHSRDFETLQKVLSERFAESCSYSDKTFSFATVSYDPNLLNKVMEMIDKLEISARRHAYEKLLVSLFKENQLDTAEVVLQKMASADCAPKSFTFRQLILFCCQKYEMDKLQWVFEMMMMNGCPPGPMCFNFVLSVLCNGKRFAQAAGLLETMAKMVCKPNAVTYDIMIRAACTMGRVQGALQLFDRLKEEGINSLYGTHTILLNGLFQIRGFNEAHSFLIHQSGKDSILDLNNYEYLIGVCNKSCRGQEARHLLMEMKAKDLELLDDQLGNDVLHQNQVSRAMQKSC